MSQLWIDMSPYYWPGCWTVGGLGFPWAGSWPVPCPDCCWPRSCSWQSPPLLHWAQSASVSCCPGHGWSGNPACVMISYDTQHDTLWHDFYEKRYDSELHDCYDMTYDKFIVEIFFSFFYDKTVMTWLDDCYDPCHHLESSAMLFLVQAMSGPGSACTRQLSTARWPAPPSTILCTARTWGAYSTCRWIWNIRLSQLQCSSKNDLFCTLSVAGCPTPLAARHM